MYVSSNETPEDSILKHSEPTTELLTKLDPGLVRQSYFVTREEIDPRNVVGDLDGRIIDALVEKALALPKLTDLKNVIQERLALDVHTDSVDLCSKVTPQIAGLPSADFVWHSRVGSLDVVVVGDVKGKGMSCYPEHGIATDYDESAGTVHLSNFSFPRAGSEGKPSEVEMRAPEWIERNLCGDFSGALMVVKSFALLDKTAESLSSSVQGLESNDGAATFLRELGCQFFKEVNSPEQSKDIAVTVLVYDPETGRGSVASAGGGPLVVARPKEGGCVFESMDVNSPSIELLSYMGAFDGSNAALIQSQEVDLRGASAFICTDGYLDTPRSFLDPQKLAEDLLTGIPECDLEQFHRDFCKKFVGEMPGRASLGRLKPENPGSLGSDQALAGQGKVPKKLPDDSLICIMSFR